MSKPNYIKLAHKERDRQRNIARHYLSDGPSISNLYNAVKAYYKSLPFVTTASTVNPHILSGDVPTPGIRNPKSIINGVSTINKVNAAKITPAQWTAAQDAAIARGDMIEAQRLRDLHFKVSAPNTKVVTEEGMPLSVEHGTVGNKYIKPFYEFSYEKARPGVYGKGFYFSRQVEPKYNRGRVIKSYLNMENPQKDVVGTQINDGIMDNVGEYFVARKPNQIKSADAVTYDNNGVRIPLGNRDNFNINDIRYGLLPFIGIGGAAAYEQRRRLESRGKLTK